MIIDCAHYRDGRRQHEGPIQLDDAAARCREGGFVWLGLFEPRPDEPARLRASVWLRGVGHVQPAAKRELDAT